MGSQFVDLNGDGHLDYLTATFDGSPHVAWGAPEGFGEPEHLLDANGERILVSYYWDHDEEQHLTTGRAFGSESPPQERCISAWAFDWDADGDLDLLLGTYENGHLYRQMNEGTATEPRFTGKLIPVNAGDGPFALPAKMTAPRMLDWDGDGDLDILAGSFGDSYGDGVGGGVYLSLNVGEEGEPAFAELVTLIEPSRKGGTEPTRPDAGLYPDAVDWDGDGDLDLVVGGYSMWTPEGRELTGEEQAEAARLQAEIAALQETRNAVYSEMSAAIEEAVGDVDPRSEEGRKIASDVRARFAERLGAVTKESAALSEALEALVPSAKRETFVWLYERL